jgi:ABC-type uncharacterized transport system permease subunit
MLATSTAALFLKIIEHFKNGDYLLVMIALVLFVLAFVVFYQAMAVWIRNRRRKRNVNK